MGDDVLTSYVAALPAVLRGKQRMVAKGIRRARAKCPVCHKPEALNLGLVPNRRDRSGYHLRWACPGGFQGME
jgi:hypothetical protein